MAARCIASTSASILASSASQAAPIATNTVRPSRILVTPSQLRTFITTKTQNSDALPAVSPYIPPSQSASRSSSTVAALQAQLEEQALRRRRSLNLKYLSELGSSQTRSSAWHPSHTRTSPPSARSVTVAHLLAATAHVGHSLSRVTPAWQPWIYGTRHGVAQIDVEHATLPALRRASKVVRDIVINDGVVLIVGTDPNVAPAVIAATRRMGSHGFHVAKERWMPGVLTNAGRLLTRAVRSSMKGYVDQLPANSGRSRNMDVSALKLASLHLKPDVVIVLNPKANIHAIREATQQSIPTIAIIDTDVDPRIVTYPIPANDESLRVRELVVGVLSKAGQEGHRIREQNIERWERDRAKQERMLRKARQMSDVFS